MADHKEVSLTPAEFDKQLAERSAHHLSRADAPLREGREIVDSGAQHLLGIWHAALAKPDNRVLINDTEFGPNRRETIVHLPGALEDGSQAVVIFYDDPSQEQRSRFRIPWKKRSPARPQIASASLYVYEEDSHLLANRLFVWRRGAVNTNGRGGISYDFGKWASRQWSIYWGSAQNPVATPTRLEFRSKEEPVLPDSLRVKSRKAWVGEKDKPGFEINLETGETIFTATNSRILECGVSNGRIVPAGVAPAEGLSYTDTVRMTVDKMIEVLGNTGV